MNSGTLIAVAALTAYVGFEAYAIGKVRHRIEPDYIHKLLVETNVASELCESDVLELRPRFTRTLQRATSTYREDLTEKNPDLPAQAIDALIEQQVADATRVVTDAVEATGCSDTTARAHFQRYRIYARKSR